MCVEKSCQHFAIFCLLIRCGPLIPYGAIDLDQHWLRQRLVAWKHQAITGTNVDSSAEMFPGIQLKAISQKMLIKLIHDFRSEITLLKLLPRLPFQWVKRMHVSIVRSPTWEHSLLVFTVHTYSRMAIKIISSVKDLNINMWKIDFFRADTKNYSNHMSCSYYLSLVNLPSSEYQIL